MAGSPGSAASSAGGVRLPAALGDGLQVVQVGAGAEAAARAGHDDADDPRVVLGRGQRVLHLGAHARGPGVQRLRTVQRDGRDRLGDLVADLLVHATAPLRPLTKKPGRAPSRTPQPGDTARRRSLRPRWSASLPIASSRRRPVDAGAAHHAAARARHRAPHQGRRQRARLHQPGARHRQDRQAGLRLRHHHRPGQRPGRPRARPALQPAPRRARHREPRPSRRGGGALGRARGEHSRARARRRRRSSSASTRGEIRGLLSLCFNPLVSLPDATLHAARRSSASTSSSRSTSSCPRPRATPTSCCRARCTRRTRARSPASRGA